MRRAARPLHTSATSVANFFSHRYTCRLMRGVAEGCAARGAGLSLVSGAAGTAGAAWSVDSALVDGFVLYCLHQGSDLVERCMRRGLPIVGIDQPPSSVMTTIRIDEHEAAGKVARAVLAGDPRRVAIVSLHTGLDAGVPLSRDTVPEVRYETTRRRLEGYLNVLDSAPRAVSTRLLEAPLDVTGDAGDSAWGAVATSLADVDAVIAMSDDVARELVGRLPRDIRVLGFDGLDGADRFTTLAQPIEEKGRIAVEAVYDLSGPIDRVLPTRLVERASPASA